MKLIILFLFFNFCCAQDYGNIAENIISKLQKILIDKNQCYRDLLYVLESVGEFKWLNSSQRWSLQMLDSAGKPPSGILTGELIWPGDYDQCRSVVAPKTESQEGFTGKYCQISFTPNIPDIPTISPLKIGLCMPSSCSADVFDPLKYLNDLEEFLLHFLDNSSNPLITYKEATCEEENEMSTSGVVCLVVFGIMAALVALGSILEYRIENKKQTQIPSSISRTTFSSTDELTSSKSVNDPESGEAKTEEPETLVKVLLCFSALSNGKKILDAEGSQGQLRCLHGLRFLSMTWVILGHTYYFAYSNYANPLDLLQALDKFEFEAILNGTLSVDTFFVLSGLLLTYLFMKSKKIKINWALFYFHRYWRLTPLLAIMLWFWASVYPNLGNGPYWNRDNDPFIPNNWWKCLLYVQNFGQMPFGWTWYLANDMQFYVISPLFLIPLVKWPIIGYIVIAILIVACWITTGVIVTVNHLAGNVADAITDASNVDIMTLVYIKPYCRIAAYLIGCFTGYIIQKTIEEKWTLKKWQVVIGWVVAIVCGMSVVYGTYHSHMSLEVGALYQSLSRSAWAVAVSWVIFACINGYAGFVNSLLSFSGFIPLSKITYAAYLIHPMVMQGYYHTMRTSLHFTHPTMVMYNFAFLVASYSLGFAASLLFEAPFIGLEKILFKRK